MSAAGDADQCRSLAKAHCSLFVLVCWSCLRLSQQAAELKQSLTAEEAQSTTHGQPCMGQDTAVQTHIAAQVISRIAVWFSPHA